MSVHIPAAVRRTVRERADERCEYCRILERYDVESLQFDHVRALSHGGRTVAANLALACVPCNRWKGPNLGAVDPATDDLIWLFDPRRHLWAEHFSHVAGRVIGLTPAGRATAALLRMNDPRRILPRAASFRLAGGR